MGRTIPSFRIAEAQEIGDWRVFRRALPKRDRPTFDMMLRAARLHTSASSAAVRASRFEGMAMAVILYHQRLLTRAVEVISEIRPEEGGR